MASVGLDDDSVVMGQAIRDAALGTSPTAAREDHRYFIKMSKTSQAQEPLSQLEKSMDVIIDVFHQYSRREGDRDTLTKTELKVLIEKQLANYLKHVKSKATIDEIMKDLDMNRDAQLSFSEVMLLITRVTIATHEHLHDVENQQQQQQHKHQQQHHH